MPLVASLPLWEARHRALQVLHRCKNKQALSDISLSLTCTLRSHRALQVLPPLVNKQALSDLTLSLTCTHPPRRNRAVQLPPRAPVAKPGNNKLGTVYAFVTGRELVGAHNAVADVQALDQVSP